MVTHIDWNSHHAMATTPSSYSLVTFASYVSFISFWYKVIGWGLQKLLQYLQVEIFTVTGKSHEFCSYIKILVAKLILRIVRQRKKNFAIILFQWKEWHVLSPTTLKQLIFQESTSFLYFSVALFTHHSPQIKP